jgi:hypothetical protein
MTKNLIYNKHECDLISFNPKIFKNESGRRNLLGNEVYFIFVFVKF